MPLGYIGHMARNAVYTWFDIANLHNRVNENTPMCRHRERVCVCKFICVCVILTKIRGWWCWRWWRWIVWWWENFILLLCSINKGCIWTCKKKVRFFFPSYSLFFFLISPLHLLDQNNFFYFQNLCLFHLKKKEKTCETLISIFKFPGNKINVHEFSRNDS